MFSVTDSPIYAAWGALGFSLTFSVLCLLLLGGAAAGIILAFTPVNRAARNLGKKRRGARLDDKHRRDFRRALKKFWLSWRLLLCVLLIAGAAAGILSGLLAVLGWMDYAGAAAVMLM